ncbi:hypothetical protein BDV93DRAFT_366028 [Ceratobasidium sp. AG-I]|nr:hypothetical protein BDV93DRAFT_366028 [Ceratobasidium sp. AG-I]
MPSRRTLSAIERELLDTVTNLSDTNAKPSELVRQLRELGVILRSPDHDINDFLSHAIRLLEVLEDDNDLQLSSSDWDALVRQVRAASRLWSTALELKSQRRLPSDAKPTTAALSTLQSLSQPDNTADSQTSNPAASLTRVNYPISADTFKLLQDAQFLYRLSNQPESTSSADQSVLSLMRATSSRALDTTQASVAHSAIEETAKRAYWDQMQDMLSSSDPKEHIDQLKALYRDLSEATSRFFPPTHGLFSLFKCPLAPTTHPLDTCVHDMRSLVAGLRERCAPIRDESLILAQRTLLTASSTSIVSAAQAIIEVAELMREDLNDFILTNASEEDAKHWVKTQARLKERETSLRISETQERLTLDWEEYLGVSAASVSSSLFARRLLETISSPHAAIFIPRNTPTPSLPFLNRVPAQLLLSVDSLLKAQDLMQAIVIVGSLRSLVPSSGEPGERFSSRVWTLVESALAGPASSPTEADVKLVNLQDEVVEAYKLAYSSTSTSAANMAVPDERLRATVTRTLRTEDPVFRLLQKRLATALEAELSQPARAANVAPIMMRTGQRLHSTTDDTRYHSTQHVRLRVKGFEDTILDEPMSRILHDIERVIQWVLFCWDEFVPIR